MKTKFTLPKFIMLAVFGILLSSCTADENEMPQQNLQSDVELTTEFQSKVGDTLPNENEPIIVRPRG